VIIYSIILSPFSASQIKPKLCIDCKFYKKESIFTSNEFGKCSLFLRENDNDYYLVNGVNNNNKEYHYCSTSRKYDDMCGKEGKFYEKKIVDRSLVCDN
jgi:hypothetical protein